jgi:hypothetical protein
MIARWKAAAAALLLAGRVVVDKTGVPAQTTSTTTAAPTQTAQAPAAQPEPAMPAQAPATPPAQPRPTCSWR